MSRGWHLSGRTSINKFVTKHISNRNIYRLNFFLDFNEQNDRIMLLVIG